VHHYLVVRLRCREDADEVLQETLVRLARAHKKLAQVDNVMA
jgi:DNA-directed RNA polymerase specialized sigma24 family protein